MNLKTVGYSELVEVSRKEAIKNKEQVLKNHFKNKSLCGKSWGEHPKDYTRNVNDLKYPTALVCDFIYELGNYKKKFPIYNKIKIIYENR